MKIHQKIIAIITLLITGVAAISINTAGSEPGDTKGTKVNFVSNPGFEIMNPATGLPDGWETKISRDEIAPEFKADKSVSHSGKTSVRSKALGSKGTFGYWTTTVTGLTSDANTEFTDLTISGGDFLSTKNYNIGCYYKTSGIESPYKNVWVRVNWLDKKGSRIFTELIYRHKKEGEWYHASQVLTAPRGTVSLNLELVFQWTDQGTVWWDDVSVEEAPSSVPRRIKVASSTEKPPDQSTTEKNMEFYSGLINEAGKAGVDLLCLGEGVTLVSTRKKIVDAAEPVPGPTSRILGEAAKKANLYVVAGIYEREGSLIYNTALLIDRQGNIAGKYRKTHLPQTEVDGGIIPGYSYPVFRTDFGTVGIEICYDNFFPEVCRQLALNGAEIILCPIWGDLRSSFYAWDIVARSRAIDNAVYFVSSMYKTGGSMIIDPDGHILPDTDKINGLTISEIDLNTRSFDRWLSVSSYGEWKSLFPQERRVETYDGIMKNSPDK